MRVDARRAFWRQYRSRQSGKGRGGVVYAVYLGVLLMLVYGAPLMRGIGTAVHDDEVEARLVSADTAALVSTVLGGVLVAAMVVGTTRGPAVVRPFVAHALTTSPISRRRAFLGAVLRSGLGVLGAALAGALVLLVPLADAGAMSWQEVGLALASSALVGVLAVAAWLAGQAAHGAALWALPLALMAVVGLGAFLPGIAVTPWAWAAATWPDGSGALAWWAVGLLGLVAVAAGAAIPALLGLLSGPSIVDQSLRWEGATTAAMTGDVTLAMGSFRARPAVGRDWRAVAGARYALAAVRADLVASIRTPLRTAVALLSLGAGGYVFAAAGAAPGLLGPGLGLAASVLVFAGLGPLADGLRHAILAISAPRLFGVSDDAMVVSRAWAPLIGGTVVSGGAAVIWALSAGRGAWQALGATVLLVTVLTLARLNMASKTTPPMWLSVPVATPMGDLSVVGTALWQIDGLVVAGIAGVAVLGAAHGSAVGTVATALLVLVQYLQWRARMASR